MIERRCAVAIALAIVSALARPVFAGDPTLEWRTVETAHFVIYYWAPLDDQARRLGVVAEHAHSLLSPALDHRPTEKTLIYLIDNTDSANGFASVLPRNAIQVNATGPSSFTELDDHEDWLYALIAHEYTHILHLDTYEGLPTIYNKIFGKTWAPNQIMPRWLIEGIAVYEESKRSAGGRNRGTRFDSYIRSARHGMRTIGGSGTYELRLDEVTGNPRQYPRGNAAYVYGSHFLRYVFDRFGDDTLRKMAHTSGSYAPPFAVNRQIAKTVGKPFTELYDDWNNYLRDHYGLQEMALERRGIREGRAITHTAESNMWPHYSRDGARLEWVQSDGYNLQYVREAPVGKGDADGSNVAQIDNMGPFDLLPDGSIVYELGRIYRTFYAFEDLFRWDARTQQTIRLTTGKRARDPAVSFDGRRIAFSMNEHTHSVLAVMPLEPGSEPSVVYEGGKQDEAYQPAWSPDGTRIAFSAWRFGGYRDILVLELASGKVTEITHDRAIDMAPAWSYDGKTLYFDSDRTGISNIYAYEDQKLWQVTNVIGGAFGARPSPDGTRLAFENTVAKGGYDLYEIPIDRNAWQPARDYLDDKPPAELIADDSATVSAPRPYRAMETLAPQTWTGTLDAASRTASLQTSGTDAVGLHSWSLALSEDLQQGNTDVGASYSYSGWRPSLSVAGSRSLVERGGWRVDGINNNYLEEDWAGTISLGIPLEQRPSSSWSLGFSYNVDWYRLAVPPPGGLAIPPDQILPTHPVTNFTEAGLATRLTFSRVRATTFGLGSQDGFDASASLRIDNPVFGSAYRNITASYGFDLYQRLWQKQSGLAPPVLALRVVGSLSAGDLVGANSYSLGGVPAQDVAMSIVNSVRTSPIGYLHGYAARSISGNQYHLANVEVRQEVWLIEHGLGTLPIYLERLHVAAMSDVATAFNEVFDAGTNVRWSVGGALRLDAFFGYFVPGTFEIGYSHGLIQGGVNETWFLLTSSL
jgi:Tol biopolymer transport system component